MRQVVVADRPADLEPLLLPLRLGRPPRLAPRLFRLPRRLLVEHFAHRVRALSARRRNLLHELRRPALFVPLARFEHFGQQAGRGEALVLRVDHVDFYGVDSFIAGTSAFGEAVFGAEGSFVVVFVVFVGFGGGVGLPLHHGSAGGG